MGVGDSVGQEGSQFTLVDPPRLRPEELTHTNQQALRQGNEINWLGIPVGGRQSLRSNNKWGNNNVPEGIGGEPGKPQACVKAFATKTSNRPTGGSRMKAIHTCGHTSFRELKEVTYECAIVPLTGIPKRKPAWTLLVKSKPEGKIPPLVCVCVCTCVFMHVLLPQQTFTSDVRVPGGGEPPVRPLSPPQSHLQQLPLRTSGHTETSGVAADQTEETPTGCSRSFTSSYSSETGQVCC